MQFMILMIPNVYRGSKKLDPALCPTQKSRMVTILTGQAEVRPELALAILERKFPQRWAKVTVVAAPRPYSRSASTCHNHQCTREGRQAT